MDRSDSKKELLDDADDKRQTLATTRRQFWQISKAFFASERRRKARGFLISLLVLALATGAVQVLMSYAGADFMTAITRKNPTEFWHTLWKYIGTILLAIPIGVYYRWVEERLALLWREWMAQHLVKRYFNNRAYFRLLGSESVDNPDQRISEDVRNFTTSSLSFMLIALNSLVTLGSFIGVLWLISGKLVAILLVYAVAGTAISIVIGRKLVRLHYQQYEKEADFRYGLVRVRDNAESIAFYRGEKREHLDLFNRLTAAVTNMRLIIIRNRNLAFFTNSYNYLALVLPIAVVAPMYMRGEVEFGVVTQAGGAFATVLTAVSLIITQFGGLSAYLAGVQRLGSLWDELDEHDAEEQRINYEKTKQPEENSRIVKLEGLTICTPVVMRTLVEKLSFELREGQSLIIMGPSGTGKSSVLRTIAGLWPGACGLLERPAADQLMFLPQRPYMVEGCLRDQLHYPYPDRGASDEEIRDVIESVNLASVLDRVEGDLDRVADWNHMLSLGEQQRIAFARLFLRKPKFAFLDEATSALDEENQQDLYTLIKESGIGYISVGHRTTLIPFHDRMLLLDRDGSWKIENVTET
ncbi:ABC transporter ATP-binding protein/permease [Luteolibacter yonseiensis]|uniref:ABC transporter ATP-binding protein/permease n=1 Tax=Luteolibacter yonseiensis TaxID=1144680 RepID=A0A934R3Z1_9BACT|nr:ABC transporter ATP-binding protein/permease [Luteolibacter yonseiensis]MBK1816464.1 ABC transporter ATP-binding protein/permease [Luteolibacter yonseiensis]